MSLPGAYALTAVALNSYGQTLTSGVVNVTVDIPSSITLTNPANNARFAAGSDIGLGASVLHWMVRLSSLIL